MTKKIFKINFLLFFYIAINPCFAQNKQEINANGYNTFYYENGKISSEGSLKDGKPDGYWKTYSETGKIKSEGNRKNYELDGIWKFYNKDGKIETEINYVKGKKDGIKRIWDTKGYILSEENDSADIKQGMSYTYFPPEDSSKTLGKIKTKTPFKDGAENGTAYAYDKNGNIISILEYTYGVLKNQEPINRVNAKGEKKGIWKDFYDNGKVKSETTYINGKKYGYVKTYSPSGSLSDIQKYEGDSIQKDAPELTTKLEVRNEYYENGSIKKTSTYLNGIAEGVQKEYSREGKITNAKIFNAGDLVGEGIMDEAGNRQGPWIEYHSNGQVKGKGDYVDGEKIGNWIFYFPNGKIEQKGKYNKKGKPQGLWQWYFHDGNPLREENYLNGKRDGTLTEWNDSGQVVTKGEYIDGLKEGKWIYELQDYREEGVYKNDQKDGPWQSYYADNNQLKFTGSYIEGLPDGKHAAYYHDGKLKERGLYVAGNKDGKWDFFNPDGTLLLTISFKNGKEIKYDGAKVKPVLPDE